MKKWIFPVFLVIKTWKLIVQFHFGQIICSANFSWDKPIFPKSTGLGLIFYIIATGGQIRSENSELKVKNTKNSTNKCAHLIGLRGLKYYEKS
jgi:hypothetical protein